MDSRHIKIVLPTRADWGWSPAFATALVLLGLFVFATAQGTASTAIAPLVQRMAYEPMAIPSKGLAQSLAQSLYQSDKSSGVLSGQALSANETSVWAMNQILREENTRLKKRLEAAAQQRAANDGAETEQWN